MILNRPLNEQEIKASQRNQNLFSVCNDPVATAGNFGPQSS